MKTSLVAGFISVAILFSACSNGASDTVKSGGREDRNVVSGDLKTNSSAEGISSEAQQGVDKDFANTGQESKVNSSVPSLTPEQRSVVDEKVNKVLRSIDSILNSIEEPKEVDLGGM
jgi:hypothetical protein